MGVKDGKGRCSRWSKGVRRDVAWVVALWRKVFRLGVVSLVVVTSLVVVATYARSTKCGRFPGVMSGLKVVLSGLKVVL